MPESAPYTPTAIIGAALPRIDGPLKTTGTAMYAADYHFPGMVYGFAVTSTVANGRIVALDASRAEAMPGVLLVLHHGNTSPLYRLAPGARGVRTSEARPPLEDEVIRYYGQYVAVVVAETFEQAQAAARAVEVKYEAQKPNVSGVFNEPQTRELPLHTESKRGDVETGFASAPVQIDQIYVTPVETHNPMEMHGTVAVWEGDRVTLYESSQGVVNHKNVLAQTLGIPSENVQVITRFMGSGFGGKLFPWPHSALAAVAARKLNRPVKLTVDRKRMFTAVGHRPRTQQRIKIGATPDGKLVSLHQDYRNHTSLDDDIRENCGEATPFLYSTPNLLVTSALVRRNVGTPTPMRGPGAVPGLFALESAMDELAVKLNMDPVQLRIQNDTTTDESTGKPFSSRHLKECLQTGAEKFGWAKRTAAVGSMKRDDLILGWGVAAASWGAFRGACQATVTLNPDGSARVSCGTQDIGTGTYTVFAQIVSDRTGVPVERVQVVLGDSSLAPGPTSGGSVATATVMPAIADACNNAIQVLLSTAVQAPGSPFQGKDSASLAFTAGRVHIKTQPPETGTSFAELLKQAKAAGATGQGQSGPLGSDTKARDYSTHSFGAQFVEVEWDPGIARLRVSRILSVIDAGRIINPRTGANQVMGAAVMGVGMGLLEQTIYDPRDAHPINDNFADYIVPTCADAPQLEAVFLDYPDPLMGEYGARGIGEIGLAGVAPAITNAVYHATGVRVRTLPVQIEDLTGAKA
jgi:xanthine dehydrogenase YagR molybdenum-binding subunit